MPIGFRSTRSLSWVSMVADLKVVVKVAGEEDLCRHTVVELDLKDIFIQFGGICKDRLSSYNFSTTSIQEKFHSCLSIFFSSSFFLLKYYY